MRRAIDRKSTRLNSSHLVISYAVFCLKKKKKGRPARAGASPPAVQPDITHRLRVAPLRTQPDRVGPVPVPVALLARRDFFFFNDTATPEIYTLSLHDALPISTRSTSTARTSVSTSPCRRRRDVLTDV